MAPHTTLIVTVDAFHPASDAASAQERELFARASWGLMASPEPLICRETALELLARAGAVEGVVVAFLSHGDRGLAGIDLRTGSVNLRKSFTEEIHVPARRGRVTGPIAGAQLRLAAIMRAIESGRLPASRVVLVDRAMGFYAARRMAWNGVGRLTGELHLIDPGPWGLTDGDYYQICRALHIDPAIRPLPAPGQPADRSQLDDEGEGEPF